MSDISCLSGGEIRVDPHLFMGSSNIVGAGPGSWMAFWACQFKLKVVGSIANQELISEVATVSLFLVPPPVQILQTRRTS